MIYRNYLLLVHYVSSLQLAARAHLPLGSRRPGVWAQTNLSWKLHCQSEWAHASFVAESLIETRALACAKDSKVTKRVKLWPTSSSNLLGYGREGHQPVWHFFTTKCCHNASSNRQGWTALALLLHLMSSSRPWCARLLFPQL